MTISLFMSHLLHRNQSNRFITTRVSVKKRDIQLNIILCDSYRNISSDFSINLSKLLSNRSNNRRNSLTVEEWFVSPFVIHFNKYIILTFHQSLCFSFQLNIKLNFHLCLSDKTSFITAMSCGKRMKFRLTLQFCIRLG